MRRTNVFAPELDGSSDREGYRRSSAAIGRQLGSERVGASLYVLDEGERTFPYHFHHAMEEWLVVVEGTPTLRSPEGERVLRPGDVVCFPTGPDGGHQVRGPGSVLILSSKPRLETIEYPDSGKVATRPPGKVFRAADAVDYWEGE
jgi:uncharacterized cupin superfamily protein